MSSAPTEAGRPGGSFLTKYFLLILLGFACLSLLLSSRFTQQEVRDPSIVESHLRDSVHSFVLKQQQEQQQQQQNGSSKDKKSKLTKDAAKADDHPVAKTSTKKKDNTKGQKSDKKENKKNNKSSTTKEKTSDNSSNHNKDKSNAKSFQTEDKIIEKAIQASHNATSSNHLHKNITASTIINDRKEEEEGTSAKAEPSIEKTISANQTNISTTHDNDKIIQKSIATAINHTDTTTTTDSIKMVHEDITHQGLPNPHSKRVAGLNCDKFGGPSPEEAQEMVYWEDIPSDAEWVSPFHYKHRQLPTQYMTFEPDRGGWNNIRWVLVIKVPILSWGLAGKNEKTNSGWRWRR